MLERLIAESRNLVVLFCKYLGYIVIALTHTCYLLKNYKPAPAATLTADPNLTTAAAAAATAGMLPQRGRVGAAGGTTAGAAAAAAGGTGGYMPVDRVRGLANES